MRRHYDTLYCPLISKVGTTSLHHYSEDNFFFLTDVDAGNARAKFNFS